MCRTSCLGISCQNDQDCESGQHCSGTYYTVCSTARTVPACNTNDDCSTGQCCGDDRNCTAGACGSKKMDGSDSFTAVFIGTLLAVTFVCFFLGICLKHRKGPRESTESIGLRHENMQFSIGRALERREENEQRSQQSQLLSLNIENLRQYTNPPPPLYPNQPPPLSLNQPPPPDLPPPAYSTLFGEISTS